MNKNSVKEALLKRRLTMGSWIQIGHPAIAEMLGKVGYEWVATDCEHTDISVEGFSNIARGLEKHGTIPLVRVSENSTMAIRKVLDAGARGVIVPLINSAEEARRAVAAAKYPPLGIRGCAFVRANNFGVDFDEYVMQANEDICVVVMIESKQGVEGIEGILSVEGVDGVLIGPYDMSGSYGVMGQTEHPIVQEACRKVSAACEKHHKAAGIHLVKPTEQKIREAVEEGFTFIALGMDTVFLHKAAAETLENAKSVRRNIHGGMQA